MTKKIILVVLTAALFGGAFLIAELTLAQRITLGIFFLAMVFWVGEVVPLFVTSLVVLLLETTVLAPAASIPYSKYVSAFFSPTLVLFLGGFTIALGLKVYRLDEALADAVLRLFGRKPFAALLGIMCTAAFISMWMSNTAATSLMLAVAIPIMNKAGGFKKAIVLGVPFAANIGGMATPVGTPPNAIALDAMRKAGMNISFLEWVAKALPVAVFLLLLAALVLYMFFRSSGQTIALEPLTNIRLTGKARFVIGVILATVVLWLTAPLHGFPESMVALLPIVAFFGTGILAINQFRELEWEILILMGGGFALGEAIMNTGLGLWFTTAMGADRLAPHLTLAIFVVIIAVMSNVVSHTSSTALVMPLAMSVLHGRGAPFALALASSVAMVLPISTPPNAIAYGTGHISTRDMALPGAIINCVGILLIYCLALLWWKF